MTSDIIEDQHIMGVHITVKNRNILDVREPSEIRVQTGVENMDNLFFFFFLGFTAKKKREGKRLK